jgi:hypothetical protein
MIFKIYYKSFQKNKGVSLCRIFFIHILTPQTKLKLFSQQN